jgi:putative ABC transport system permease protein
MLNNLRDAVRQLNRRPGLSIVIIAILGIGIGVTTGVFSLFQQILLRPLPVPEPERLVNLAPEPVPVFSYPMFRDLEARQDVFTGLATYDEIPSNVAYQGVARAGTSMAVSGRYFEVLGLEPALGRLIGSADEPALDDARVAVLSYAYWRNSLGGDPAVVGRTLTVNGEALTIVGVAPAVFSGTEFASSPQVFVPLTLRFLLRAMPRNQAQNRFAFGFNVFGRLRPGVELAQAAASINTLHSAIVAELEPTPAGAANPLPPRTIALLPGGKGQRTEIAATVGQPLTLLLGLTFVVLLVVCSNVANLLLARGAARANEMAIRGAIGASRGQLLSQLLAEAGVLALIGGLLSLPIAALTLEIIQWLVPAGVVNEFAIELQPAFILLTVAVSLSTVLLFGVAPAVEASRAGARLIASSPGAHALAGHGSTRFRSALTTSQIAFSVVLLVLAALFAQSLANVARVNLGVDVDSLVTFNVAPQRNGYGAERVNAAYSGVEEALRAVPGVTGVASTAIPLLSDSRFGRGVEGFDVPVSLDDLVPINMVSPGLFATLGVQLLAGRDFDATDTASSPSVVIVNQSFVRRFNLGDDVIGRRFRVAGGNGELQIVGLVADAASSGSGAKADVPAQYYQPFSQVGPFAPSRYFYVRSSLDPAALLRTIPQVVAGVDPDLPVDSLRTLEAQFASNVYVDRLVGVLSASFAILATLLAAIGLYGMLTYSVTQRTRELGVRLALGAVPARLRAMVLKQVGAMTAIGCGVGIAAAIALGKAVEAMLFGVSGYDPLAFAVAVAVLCLVVLAASYLPARRASSVAPMAALRYE